MGACYPKLPVRDRAYKDHILAELQRPFYNDSVVDVTCNEFPTTSVLLSKILLNIDRNNKFDIHLPRELKAIDFVDFDQCYGNEGNDVQFSEKIKRTSGKRRRFSVECFDRGWTSDPKRKTNTFTSNPKIESEQHQKFIEDTYKLLECRSEYLKYTPDDKSEDTFLETANSRINEREFCKISKAGYDGWFRDNAVNMGFDILDRLLNAEKHRIALCKVYLGNHLYRIGFRKERAPYSTDLVAKCRNKDFIVIPINDGYHKASIKGASVEHQKWFHKKGYIENVDYTMPEVGVHWSVLVVDCRATTIKGRYFDSLCGGERDIAQSENAKVARRVLQGLRRVLHDLRPRYYDAPNDDGPDVDLSNLENSLEILRNTPERPDHYSVIDENTPNQSSHNVRGNIDGNGACGPFIWAITKEITQYIVDSREDPSCCTPLDISLPGNFKYVWRWNSMQTRETIKSLLRREYRTRGWLNKTYSWMNEPSGKTGWESWLRARGLPETYFYNPYQMQVDLAPQYADPL